MLLGVGVSQGRAARQRWRRRTANQASPIARVRGASLAVGRVGLGARPEPERGGRPVRCFAGRSDLL